MSEGFVVDCEALLEHAEAVARSADALVRASEAARPLPTEAFGLIGRPFARELVDAGTSASGAIAALARQARSDEIGLCSVVAAYRRNEAEQVRRFESVEVGRAGDR